MRSQTQVRPTQSIPTEPSDETLAERIAQRDRAAFSALYDRYARAVFVFAVYFLGNADAEEVVQEIFLRLWKKASQFDSQQGAFRYWFMTIARNYVLDELRRRGNKHRVVAAEEINDLLADAPDPSVNVDEQVWANHRAHAILEALKILPEEQRRVIVFAYFGGLTQSEIAQQMQVPLGTIKKRIRLGLQKLRAFLSEQKLS